jgi:3-deoxy-7-phosphoheptulonate synthase
MSILNELRLVKKKSRKKVVKIGNVEVGKGIIIIAGPCAVESKYQLFKIAKAVKKLGASILRGGAFKPRTSPYSFQGLGKEGLEILAEIREKVGMPIVTEVMSVNDVEVVSKYVDALQIGARNMQNFPLLKEVGKTKMPVILKRGFGCTIEEWLAAAEYVLLEENENVILCERGIRTFENLTRFTLDISSIPIVKQLTSLPIIVDPSHAAGKAELVEPLALASIAAGADGIMVEVHYNPKNALSDGKQSLTIPQFKSLMKKIERLKSAFKNEKH